MRPRRSGAFGGRNPVANDPVVRKLQRGLLLVLLLACVGGIFFLLRFSVGHPQRTPDFIGFYAAGTLVRHGRGRDLYRLSLQRNIQRQLAPHGQFLPFDHAPFEALLFAPLSYLSYPHAFMVWSALNLALLALVFFLLRYTGYRFSGVSGLAWIAAWIVPVAEAVAVGQDSIFLALVFLVAFLALKRKRDFAAGLALGAGLYRFEILLPFAFVFLLRKRGRILSGFFLACATLFLVSLAVVGWTGIGDYLEVLRTVGRTGGSSANGVIVKMMPSLRAALVLLAGHKLPPTALFLIVLAGTILLLGWAAWRFSDIARPANLAFDLEFSLAVVAALLASYHLFAHELTPLIPAIFVMIGYEEEARLRNRPSVLRTASLLLLCFLMFPGAGYTIERISALFFLLLGLGVWISLELRALRRFAAHAGVETSPARSSSLS